MIRADLGLHVPGELAGRVGSDGDPVGLGVDAAEDEDVLVVVVVRGLGVVEAAGDDDALVDHHQLVVELAHARGLGRLEELDVRVLHRLRRGPAVRRLAAVDDARDLHAAPREGEHRVVDPRGAGEGEDREEDLVRPFQHLLHDLELGRVLGREQHLRGHARRGRRASARRRGSPGRNGRGAAGRTRSRTAGTRRRC